METKAKNKMRQKIMLFFSAKVFIFHKYICEMYKL